MALSAVLKWPISGRNPTIVSGSQVGKVRMRLTAAGWGFLTLVLCGFLMSVNFSNNLIFAMTFLLIGIAMVSWWQTRSNLHGLQLSEWRCEPVYAGQKVQYRLAIDNPTNIERFGLRLETEDSLSTDTLSVIADTQIETILTRVAELRGVLEPVDVHLVSSFPIGLFEARMATPLLPTCLVYPAPGGSQTLPDQASGQHAHQRRESGSFTEMRRYAPGDPLSRIAWQALARSDEVYTKDFDGADGKPALWLTWEMTQTGIPDEKLSQLCRWVLEAQRQGREYGLDIPGAKVIPANDESHRRSCLRALALYGRADMGDGL